MYSNAYYKAESRIRSTIFEMPPKKTSPKLDKNKIQVTLLFLLKDLVKKNALFNETLDDEDINDTEVAFKEALKKINKLYVLNFVLDEEPGLEVFLSVPKKGWSKKKLDNLGKKLESEIDSIQLGENGDRGFRIEYYIAEKHEADKITSLPQKDKKEIETKLKAVKFDNKELVNFTWTGNSVVLTYDIVGEKKGRTKKTSPKSTPQKKKSAVGKDGKYIFVIDRDEYEYYYYGPFTLDSKQKELLEKEIVKYNEFSEKLFNGEGPKKSYSSEASRKQLLDREHPPLGFKLVKEDKTDDEWDFYQTGDYSVKLNGKEIREIITSPYDAYSSVSMGYKILPETKKILKL